MARLKCYQPDSYSLCKRALGYHALIGGYPSSNPAKRLGITPPLDCIPKPKKKIGADGKPLIGEDGLEVLDWSEVIAFYKRLHDDYCVSLLAVYSDYDQYYPAIMAGWEKKDMLLQVSSFDIESLLDAENFSNDYLKEYQKANGIEQKEQSFHGVWADEPHKWAEYPVLDDMLLFRVYVNGTLHTDFVCSEYWTFLTDYRSGISKLCDRIMDDGYNHERWVWADAAKYYGMKSAWINFKEFEDSIFRAGEALDYLDWANELNFDELWLYFGMYTSEECDKFWNDLNEFCKLACRRGWAKPREEFVIDEIVYCQRSDCKESEGKSLDDAIFWGPAPLGPICPKHRMMQTDSSPQYYNPFIANKDLIW
jgi:hypothetical protein